MSKTTNSRETLSHRAKAINAQLDGRYPDLSHEEAVEQIKAETPAARPVRPPDVSIIKIINHEYTPAEIKELLHGK